MSTEKLFSFPETVNDTSARLVATGVVTMAAASIAFDLRWLPIVMAYGFVARVLAGPKLSPLALLVTKVITPALPYPEKIVPGPPKRFAQGIGAAFTVSVVIATYGFGRFDIGQVLLGLLIIPAFLEAALGYCVGCQIFALLMRAGVIPEETCEACNDIWNRPKVGAGSPS